MAPVSKYTCVISQTIPHLSTDIWRPPSADDQTPPPERLREWSVCLTLSSMAVSSGMHVACSRRSSSARRSVLAWLKMCSCTMSCVGRDAPMSTARIHRPPATPTIDKPQNGIAGDRKGARAREEEGRSSRGVVCVPSGGLSTARSFLLASFSVRMRVLVRSWMRSRAAP